MEFKIVVINKSDAKQYSEFVTNLFSETNFMLNDPNEFEYSEKIALNQINSFFALDENKVFVAKKDDEIIGFIQGFGQKPLRKKHILYVVVGVTKKYWRQGVGAALVENILSWSDGFGYSRVELTVVANNFGAINLYKKYGFNLEGKKLKSFFVDGKYEDELMMARIIDL